MISRTRIRPALRPLVLPLALLAAWTVASAAGWTNAYLLPSPAAVARAAADLLTRGDLAGHVAASLARVGAGFALTVAMALPLAILCALLPRLHDHLRLVLEVMRVTPPLALVPLLILWLGIGEASKLAVVVLASFFPVFMNTLGGLRDADGRLLELAHTLDLTPAERTLHVLLPAALPAIITGLRLGFGYSWRALVGAELIAASAGLGYLIIDAGEMARTDRVFVGIVAIAALGAASDWLFRRLSDRLAPWRHGEPGAATAQMGG
ncbi:ABC transporter permease [Caenispirillum bisanense]|uniref:ABC transporter permease n=1 Tax=Caenispirillum bisanense TaxID=414052 RepID=UPI0031D2E9C7